MKLYNTFYILSILLFLLYLSHFYKKVNSTIIVLESFSTHADMNDLDAYIKNIKGLKRIMLVHGEETQSGPMAGRCKKNLKIETIVMEPEKTVEL